MAEKKINAGLKMALEFGPLVLFLAAFMFLKDRHFLIGGADYKGIIIVTGLFIIVMTIATGLLWALTGSLSRMQVFSLISVILLGGATVFLNDERYLKMKPTVFYLVCASILGAGLLQGKSYLQSLMGTVMPLRPEGWMILTRRFAVFFFALAIFNELIWRNFSTETWVYFKVFGLLIATVLFVFAQSRIYERFAIEEDGADPKA